VQAQEVSLFLLHLQLEIANDSNESRSAPLNVIASLILKEVKLCANVRKDQQRSSLNFLPLFKTFLRGLIYELQYPFDLSAVLSLSRYYCEDL